MLNNPERLKSLRNLYTDICNSLGINGLTSSHYGGFVVNGVECSIRVSNHNANAHTYEIDLNNNISIKIRPRINQQRFIPSQNATVEEFVYFDYMISHNENLICDIIDSIIDYLTTGEFLDKSGQAKKNYSPDFQSISHQRIQQTLQRKDNEDEIDKWHMGETLNFNYNINTMTNNKKKALYESIMKDVAKIVKSRINEQKYKRFGKSDLIEFNTPLLIRTITSWLMRYDYDKSEAQTISEIVVDALDGLRIPEEL